MAACSRRTLTNIVHEEDRTRPTTAGFNNDTGAIKNELAAAVDIPASTTSPPGTRRS